METTNLSNHHSNAILTTTEVAHVLRVSVQRVRAMAAKGVLKPVRKAPGGWLFDAAEVLRLSQAERKPGRPKLTNSHTNSHNS